MAGLRRWFAALVVGSLCVTLISVGDVSPAYGDVGCDQLNPTADVSVSQTATEVVPNTIQHVILTNFGPCNVPDAELKVTLPTSAVEAISTNPSGWTWTVVSNVVTFHAPAPTIGVPGIHDFFVTFPTPIPPAAPTVTAEATLSGGFAPCTGTPLTTCDPVPDNNTNWGGFVGAGGGTIQTGQPGQGPQTTQVTIPPGHPGAVDILQLASDCPVLFPNCFGKLVSIQSVNTGSDRQLKVFTYEASTVPVSFARLTMRHCPINQCALDSPLWATPPACDRKLTDDPCILSKKRFKGPGGVVFFQVLVSTSVDDSWFGD